MNWKDLPSEISFHIFSYLNQTDLTECSSVSKSWYILANDDFLWKRLFLEKGANEPCPCAILFQENSQFLTSWKAKYILCSKNSICSLNHSAYVCMEKKFVNQILKVLKGCPKKSVPSYIVKDSFLVEKFREIEIFRGF